jgi:hypothetical protein
MSIKPFRGLRLVPAVPKSGLLHLPTSAYSIVGSGTARLIRAPTKLSARLTTAECPTRSIQARPEMSEMAGQSVPHAAGLPFNLATGHPWRLGRHA